MNGLPGYDHYGEKMAAFGILKFYVKSISLVSTIRYLKLFSFFSETLFR